VTLCRRSQGAYLCALFLARSVSEGSNASRSFSMNFRAKVKVNHRFACSLALDHTVSPLADASVSGKLLPNRFNKALVIEYKFLGIDQRPE
jgi:hypothetical protein